MASGDTGREEVQALSPGSSKADGGGADTKMGENLQ